MTCPDCGTPLRDGVTRDGRPVHWDADARQTVCERCYLRRRWKRMSERGEA